MIFCGVIQSPASSLTGYIVDDYPGMDCAFSIRKIWSGATYSMRIRRSSDNAEANIGFYGDDLDTAAIASHCGAGTGEVVKWYDQSGNSNDAVQSTTSFQPQIWNGSAILTLNGISAIDFSNHHFLLTSSVNMSGVDWSSYVVGTRKSSGRSPFFANSASGGIISPTLWTDNNMYFQKASTYYFAGDSTTAQTIINSTLASGSPTVRHNGAAYSLSSGGNSGTDTIDAVGRYSSTSFVVVGYGQEAILYSSNQAANTSGIETNQNDYYGAF